MLMSTDKRDDDGDVDSTSKSSVSTEQARLWKLYMHPLSVCIYITCLIMLIVGIVLICSAQQPHCGDGCTSERCIESSTNADGGDIQNIYHCLCADDTLEGFYCGKQVQRQQDHVFYGLGIGLIVLCPFLLLNMRAWFALLGYRNNLVLVAEDENSDWVEEFCEFDEENTPQKPRSDTVDSDTTVLTVTSNGSRHLPSKFPVNLRNNRTEFEPVVDIHESTFASAENRNANEGDLALVDVRISQV